MPRILWLAGELRRRRVFRVVAAYAVFAFVVWQAADFVIPAARLPDWVSTLTLILTILGFPVAMVLAWLFDITPEGLKRTDRAEARRVRERPAASAGVAGQRSIVVLPFDNLSPDPGDAYFADGLTEEIITDASCCGLLRVVSRNSAVALKGKLKDTRTIAEELDVQYVLEGSVRKAGDDLRITAQLIDARTDEHIWAEKYGGTLQDVFALQEQVSQSIVDALRLQLDLEETPRLAAGPVGAARASGTLDVAAYDAYLRGRFLWNQRTESALEQSFECFASAIERDPNYALAHAGRADSYVTLGVYGTRLPSKVMEAAREAAAAALDIDPTLARALTAQACVKALYDWDWAAAEADFRAALENDPEYATAHQWYANYVLIPLRRFDEAQRQLGLAAQLEPLSSAVAASRGVLGYFRRDYEGAMGEYESTRNLHPHFGLIHLFIGQCLVAMGRHDEALRALRTAVELTSESSEALAALSHGLAVSGNTREAAAVLEGLEARAREGYVSPVLAAQVLTGLGKQTEALDRLEKAAAQRASDLVWSAVRPVFDPIRSQLGFVELTRTIGLV
ncbi:MAG: tetratricopeptide repeat protein [Gemmatimonadota bacterium]|nr:MAG: tetratricopeptide repeat protein [Gemmatimonadota bacterium]